MMCLLHIFDRLSYNEVVITNEKNNTNGNESPE